MVGRWRYATLPSSAIFWESTRSGFGIMSPTVPNGAATLVSTVTLYAYVYAYGAFAQSSLMAGDVITLDIATGFGQTILGTGFAPVTRLDAAQMLTFNFSSPISIASATGYAFQVSWTW